MLDRGFQSYKLFDEIITAGSDFVVRLRETACCHTLDPRPLTAADLAAGVLGDALVRVGWRPDQTPVLPRLRRVEVAVDGKDEPLVILTSCLDLPAELISLIYKQRWQVELFFRWLKCMAHLEHFYSESARGMTLQLYVTLSATLLIALETGAQQSVYDYSLMSLARGGMAPLEEVLQVAEKRRAERLRAKQRRHANGAQYQVIGFRAIPHPNPRGCWYAPVKTPCYSAWLSPHQRRRSTTIIQPSANT